MYRFIVVFVSLFSSFVGTQVLAGINQSQEAQRLFELLPDFPAPPALELAVPKALRAFNVSQGAPSAASLYTGVLWATERTLKEYQESCAEGLPNISQGAFLVCLSHNVAQSGPSEFVDGGLVASDGVLRQQLKLMGVENPRIKRFNWGSYPVLAVEATTSAFDQPLAMAWVGTNYDSFVIRVSYVFSKDSVDHKDDWEVWRTFLEKTVPMPPGKLATNASD